jgi:hypothetical protein
MNLLIFKYIFYISKFSKQISSFHFELEKLLFFLLNLSFGRDANICEMKKKMSRTPNAIKLQSVPIRPNHVAHDQLVRSLENFNRTHTHQQRNTFKSFSSNYLRAYSEIVSFNFFPRKEIIIQKSTEIVFFVSSKSFFFF